jgi:hypothetical protein
MKIAFSAGEYSDYYIVGYYEVPSMPWIKERLQQWMNDHPTQWQKYNFKQRDFVTWLTTWPEVEDLGVDITEVHLGDYSCLDVDERIMPTETPE